MRATPRLGLVLALALLAPACVDGDASRNAAGVVESGAHGPSVRFDPLHRPVPEVPLPNDLMLRPDNARGEGAVWNISPEAPTKLEQRLRRTMQQLEGFGVFAPIQVSFSGPLDITSITDEAIVVINIEAGHPREGEIAALDLGKGYFPFKQSPQGPFWANDEVAYLPDLIFPEDNWADLDGDGEDERLEHYEYETNTLLIRPLMPLAPGAEHAVLLKRDLVGWLTQEDQAAGESPRPIRSPFPFKAHAAQATRVARGMALAGVAQSELAFGWTFTTMDATRPFRVFRQGLYGEGPLARLAQDFPAVIREIRSTDVTHDGDGDEYPLDERDHVYILQSEMLDTLLAFVQQAEPSLSATLTNVDYLVFGTLETPNLMTGEAGTLGVDMQTGEGEIGTNQVPFMIAVPRTTERHKPPFPVALHFHGTYTSRIEAVGLADALARQGVAVIGFDQVGHGPIVPDVEAILRDIGADDSLIQLAAPFLASLLVPDRVEEFEDLSASEALTKMNEIGAFAEFAVVGRAWDENGDGAVNSGENFFYADPFRQCASFEQGVMDFMQIVRMLRTFDPDAIPDPIDDPDSADPERLMQNMLAGDFNADGVLDIGGPDVTLTALGLSLGGFHAMIGGAMEPEVVAVAPNVSGAGFVDVMLRSRLRRVTEVIFYDIFGPLVVGCPDGEGGVWLSLNNESDYCKQSRLEETSFGHLPSVAAGSTVTVHNLTNGEAVSATVGPSRGFAIPIESDKWDQWVVTLDGVVGPLAEVPVVSPYEGTALPRNTPDFRRFISIAAHVLDKCDPVAFIPYLTRDPLPGHPVTNILMTNALGDLTVPISTGITAARVAGALGPEQADWEPRMEALIAHGATLGSDYDVDDMLGDNPPEQPAIGPIPPLKTETGESAIRFAYVDGKHEWIVAIDQGKPFDYATFGQNQIALFLASGGAKVVDDVCLADAKCPYLDDPTPLLQGD